MPDRCRYAPSSFFAALSDPELGLERHTAGAEVDTIENVPPDPQQRRTGSTVGSPRTSHAAMSSERRRCPALWKAPESVVFPKVPGAPSRSPAPPTSTDAAWIGR